MGGDMSNRHVGYPGRKRRWNHALVVVIVASQVLAVAAHVSPSLSHHPSTTIVQRRWARFLPWKRKRHQLDGSAQDRGRSWLDSQGSESQRTPPEETTDDGIEDKYIDHAPYQPQSPWAFLAEKISTIHPATVGRVLARCLQVGMLSYLGYTVWKIATDIATAVTKDDNDSLTGSSFVKNQEDVQKILELIHMDPSTEIPLTPGLVELPLQLVRLGQKLRASGVPVFSRGNDQPSIEKLFRTLTKEEAVVLEQCLIHPPDRASNAPVGLTGVQQHLHRTAALLRQSAEDGAPPHFPSLFGTGRSSIPGILLYGPPGCGKTLLVQGLAAQAPCLVLTPSVIFRKYLGESNAQVRRLFSLLSKLAPCILCIDELDGLFRERNDREDAVARELKTEFFQWWDGLLTTKAQNILVIGATNRPFDVDAAVLRRLPQSYFVGFPDTPVRFQILRRFLADVPLVKDFQWAAITGRTAGYSPSDIRNLLQMATVISTGRQLSHEDVLRAMHIVAPPRLSPMYKAKMQMYLNGDHNHVRGSGEENDEDESDGTSTRWQTNHGNFYHLGTLEIDPATFEALTEIAKAMIEDNDDEDI